MNHLTREPGGGYCTESGDGSLSHFTAFNVYPYFMGQGTGSLSH
jgi:hypothetical protein